MISLALANRNRNITIIHRNELVVHSMRLKEEKEEKETKKVKSLKIFNKLRFYINK